MIVATALFLLLAITSLQLARAAHIPVGPSFAASAAVFTGLIALRWMLRRWVPQSSPRWTSALGAAFAAIVIVGSFTSLLPLAGEEIVLALLLSVAAALFVGAKDRSALGRTALLSGVVVLFALPGVGEQHRLPVIVAAAGCGSFWLIVSAQRNAADRWTWAYRASLVAAVVGICLLAHHVIRPTDGNPWYAAWVPTSGGDRAGDENARRGTGDGPDEISGQSASSVGFDRSDTFSESGRDGLYDLWVEAYGQPVKPGDQQKMIGLKPKDVTVVRAPDRENLKVGRSFEMRRKADSSTAPMPQSDAGASARAWVKGPMPVYLPLATFTDFDGVAWQVDAHGKPSVPARKLDESSWMEILLRPLSPAFAGTSEHEIRVGDLGGDVLPMPPLVERFKMGRVNKPDFFASTRSGFVKLARRSVPAGATLDVASKNVSPARLMGVEPALPKNSDPSVLSTQAIDGRVRAFAVDWGANRSRGWRQIEQVVARLRAHVTLDRNMPRTMSSEGSANTIHDLLFVDRRGPDYAVASTAVMLLRSLDYPTRLVSGLYADESGIDARSGFAALNADDVHFWIEVRLADGTWITVDPSPGYPMLNFPVPMGERLAGVWSDTRRAITTHAMAIGVAVAALTVTFLARRRLIDAVATALCRLRGCDARRVLRVIELRARLLRRPRPPSLPVGGWLAALDAGPHLLGFIDELNRSLYRSDASPQGVTLSAKTALDRLTLKTIRNLSNEMK